MSGERPRGAQRRDFVIVGGGPAGMSAALVATQNGIDTLLLEASARLGGQVRWADAAVPDLLGVPAGDGNELADRFAAHLLGSRADVRTEAPVAAVRLAGDAFSVRLAGGEELAARRVLLATGLTHRRLGVAGEDLANRVASPRKVCERFDGHAVAVVGGGDEASSLACDLAAHGARVTLLVRREMRARPRYADAARRRPGVEIRLGAVVSRLEEEGRRLAVVLASGERLEVDECFVRIGVEPALPVLEPPPQTLADGRVRVDAELRTTCPGLFAAGDLVRPAGEHYIAAALADGAVVARRVEADLAGR